MFVFRLLAEGQLTNDHYLHLALAQRFLLGDLPGRDFIDPGLPLMYLLSALAQSLKPGPFSEVVLTATMLAIAAGVTYGLAARLTRSWFWPIVAVFIEAALWPRPYSYPKVLVPVLVLAAWWRYASQPSSRKMWALAGCNAIGVLLRHDLGAFSILAVSAAICTTGSAPRERLRIWLRYLICTAVFLAPYQLFLVGSGGIIEHVRQGLEFSRSDSHQLLFRWSELPELPRIVRFDREEAATTLYYGSWLFFVLGIAASIGRREHEHAAVTSTLAAAVMFLGCYIVVILRHPIVVRVPDAAAVLAVLTVCCTAHTVRWARAEWLSHRVRAVAAAGVVVLLCVATVTSAATLGRVAERFHETRLMDGVAKARERLSALAHAGTVWPWAWYWPNGDLPGVIHYLKTCTAPEDRVLVTWPAPEYFYYAQRGGGAGQVWFMPRRFARSEARQRVVERLERERVPIALINESTRDELSRVYPELEALLSGRYFTVGHFSTRGAPQVAVAVRTDFLATGSYGAEKWPCGFTLLDGEARR